MDDKLTRVIVIQDGENIGSMDVTEKEMEEYYNEKSKLFPAELKNLLRCESPIERLLYFDLSAYLETEFYGDKDFTCEFEIIPQAILADYRVDFLIETMFTVKKLDALVSFSFETVIECDGHDFHEKTKEQVARGKKRDRDLMAEGYNVLHFSGSEIWSDSFECKMQICSFIRGRCVSLARTITDNCCSIYNAISVKTREHGH